MKKKLLASVAAALCLSAATASAADLPSKKAPVEAPEVEGPPSWTGFYLGLNAGGGFGTTGIRHGVNDPSHGLLNRDITNGFNVGGVLGGFTLGAQYQTGAFVFGVESDFDITSIKATAEDVAPFNTDFAHHVSQEFLSTYRGRVGFTTGKWLLFATGGGALSQIHQVDFENLNCADCLSVAQRQLQWGWTVGGGAEWKFDEHISFKADYLYVHFPEKSYFTPGPNALFVNDQRVRLNQHVFRVGFNYLFDLAPPAAPVVAKY